MLQLKCKWLMIIQNHYPIKMETQIWLMDKNNTNMELIKMVKHNFTNLPTNLD